jgi:hypothetical protein
MTLAHTRLAPAALSLIAAAALLGGCDLASLTGGSTSFVESCQQVSSDGADAGGPVLTGRARSATGAPVAALTVLATNNMNGRCTKTTGAPDGSYRLPLPAGAYTVSARADVQYAGTTWSLRLLPADGDKWLGSQARETTKDFVLVRSCADFDPCQLVNDQVAGVIRFKRAPGVSIQWTEAHRIRLTLEPTGPLADGATIGTITRDVPAYRLEASFQEPIWAVQDPPSPVVSDIPLGTYTATAIAETMAGDVPLGLSVDGSTFSATLPIAFAPQVPDYAGATGIAELMLTIR